MKIAICDDDINFIDTLCPLLEKWGAEHDILLTLYPLQSGDSLPSTLHRECIDLILLDVVMPMLNGIETARELRNHNQDIPIIFLSSSREFAVDSYELKAFNYLLKPISKDRLFAVLDDFLNTSRKKEETFTVLQTDMGFCKINLTDVVYLEAQNKQVKLYRLDGSVLIVHEQISKCEELFSQNKGFFRCHRSYLVNLNYIQEFTKNQITTNNGTIIPISRKNYTTFKEAYLDYMFTK